MKVVRKLFFAWNEVKEQEFLEDMAKKGYKLTSVGFGRYTFEEIQPVEAVYQFDFKGIDQRKEDEYLQFYEDAGWECITRFGGWYYFYQEKQNDDTDLSIFNDNASKREKFKRLLFFLIITGFPLYYQALIILPFISREGLLGEYYIALNIIVYTLTTLHGYALARLALGYRKLTKKIKE